ncbi:unnamed protein product [Lactuca saligna]|uniref:Uncharacterized protein n=1 Tax=Lactuca saligna TaxID=75948 RepID=A0AA35VUJ0_LACSI|nr:unnamed protein product [Lactuca saligna]
MSRSRMKSQSSSQTQELKTLSTTSKVVLFDMNFLISQNLSTLNKYVCYTMQALLIMLLEPSPEPLEMPLNVPYPRWLGLFLYQKEGYVESHGIIIPIPVLSSKIIYAALLKDHLPFPTRMQMWTEKPYVIESSYFEEDNSSDDASDEENNDDSGDEEYNDEDSKVGNKEGADQEEGSDKNEED